MTVKTCQSCLWSLADYKDGKTVWRCWPGADSTKEKKAEVVCDDYCRAAGADEPEGVK